MPFTSPTYLVFFCAVFVVYWLLPARYRWCAALAAGVLFYVPFGTRMLLVLALCIVASYILGRILRRAAHKKWALAIAVCLALCPLLFYKYGAPLIESRSQWLLAPVGLSFFTFKIISYLVEVWRGGIAAETHFGRYALYVSFFPQVASGPIQRPADLLGQIKAPHAFITQQGIRGGQLVLWGFFKKLALADNLAYAVSNGFLYPETVSGPAVLAAIVMYAFQLYCDFSGYSDIAIGCAMLLGYDTPDNFNSPYFATSIRDFWSRWHISLSSFLRDYVYFPLGGSRKGTVRTCINLLLTFFISGLWHGTGMTFIVWGMLHGLYQVVGRLTHAPRERLWRLTRLAENGVVITTVKTLVTFALVTFAWVFFGSADVPIALAMLRQIPNGFSLSPQVWANGLTMLGMSSTLALRLCAGLLLLLTLDFAARRQGFSRWLSAQQPWLQVTLCYVFVLFILFIGAPGSGSFLYFQF